MFLISLKLSKMNSYNYDICQSGLCFNDENDEEVPSIEYNPLKYILLNCF